MRLSANFPKANVNRKYVICVKLIKQNVIKQKIQNIKNEVLKSGNNLIMKKEEYKEFILKHAQSSIPIQDINTMMKDFDEMSKDIVLSSLEGLNINIADDLPVSEFLKQFKYSLMIGYIANTVFKSTHIELDSFSVN